MIKNIIKTAVRSLLKNKLFSVINILGLAFGMTCSLLISLWIWDEVSHDKFHENGSNIYRIMGAVENNGEQNVRECVPAALAQPMLDHFPEIESVARVFPAKVTIQSGESRFTERGIYADPSFLTLFSFPLIEGEAHLGLNDAYSVVISKELADKYFPNENALGKTISIIEKEERDYIVGGVMAGVPEQSSLQFDFVMVYETFEKEHRSWWSGQDNKYAYTNFNMVTYAVLNPATNVDELNVKLGTFLTAFTGIDTKDGMFMYPFEEYYLHSDFSEGKNPTGKIQYVNLMSIVTLVVLLIACINFVNLSTAKAGKRLKEVGLRKTVGATKVQVWVQFIVESVVLSVIAMFIAVTVTDLLMPFFNFVTGKQIDVPLSNMVFLSILASMSILIGVIAGCYPALYLASFTPISTLKNATNKGALSGLRKGLVIVQFAMSIIFIVFSLVVFNQIEFILNKELGLKKDNIIYHPLQGISQNSEAYKAELLSIPSVQSVGFSEQDPINTSNANRGVSWNGKPKDEEMYFNVMQVGEGFVNTFEFEIIEGVAFDDNNLASNKRAFLINESTAEMIGYDDPIGMDLKVWGLHGKVVGVVKDFHHRSLSQSIEPLVMIYNRDDIFSAYIAVNSDDMQQTLAQIESVYSKYESNYSFDYTFLDEQFLKANSEVITIKRLAYLFSIASIIISCLGLYGLSAFVTEQRTKETGIRKVLGASEAGLIGGFSFEFMKVLMIAFVIALPIVWIYSSQWLSSFAYHVDLEVQPFAIAGIVTISIALITITHNTYRAAKANPIDSLKYE